MKQQRRARVEFEYDHNGNIRDYRPAYTVASSFVDFRPARLHGDASFIHDRIDYHEDSCPRPRCWGNVATKRHTRVLSVAIFFGVVSLVLLITLIVREVTVYAEYKRKSMAHAETALLKEQFPYFFRTDEEQEDYLEEITEDIDYKQDSFVGRRCAFQCRAPKRRREHRSSSASKRLDDWKSSSSLRNLSGYIRELPKEERNLSNYMRAIGGVSFVDKIHSQDFRINIDANVLNYKYKTKLEANNDDNLVLSPLFYHPSGNTNVSRINVLEPYRYTSSTHLRRRTHSGRPVYGSQSLPRKRRTTKGEVDNVYHACCRSYTKRGTAPRFQDDTKGAARELVQVPGFRQYFDVHVCLQMRGCTGCRCLQPIPSIQQAVVYRPKHLADTSAAASDLYEVANLVFPGCCRCMNVAP